MEFCDTEAAAHALAMDTSISAHAAAASSSSLSLPLLLPPAPLPPLLPLSAGRGQRDERQPRGSEPPLPPPLVSCQDPLAVTARSALARRSSSVCEGRSPHARAPAVDHGAPKADHAAAPHLATHTQHTHATHTHTRAKRT